MSHSPRILAFAGSTRRGSYNKMLVRVAAEGARRAGAEVEVIDLADFPLPLYDRDLEVDKGMPENGRRLKELFANSDGLLIASPEYNSSLSAVLKNTLDWVSRRSEPDEKPLLAFRGRAAAIMSASPGRLGGLRGLVHLRSILGNLGVLVLPEQRTVSGADKAFAENGALQNEEQQEAVRALGEKLATVLTKLSA